jgi:cell wall-associated NlpC family hydrolase
LVAIAVAAAVGLVPTPAIAAPPAPDPTQQLNALTQQAGLLNEQVLQAQSALTAKRAELDKANAAAASASTAAADARAQESTSHQQVDQLAAASFQGAQFNQLSALLTSSSTQQFLDQSTMLDILARENQASISQLAGLVAQTAAADKAAQAAQQQAQQATDAAAKISSDLAQRQQALDGQIAQVKSQVAALSAAAQSARANAGTITASPSAAGSFAAPPGIGIRGAALQVALQQLGKSYTWGGAGPSTFDCSGLVLYAYAQQGISLPHSAQMQAAMGQSIPRSAVQAGDLVFFGTPGNIYHEGIAVSNTEMVNAADYGIPVRVQAIWPNDYAGARRL